MTEAGKENWGEVMSWWKAQSEVIQKIIRKAACNKLVENGAEEIGSSDANHAVYSLYQSYKAAGSPESIVTFLLDY